MDRTGKKRKAAPASSPDERDAKRQKTPDPYYVPETNETLESVKKIGHEFLTSLKKAKDKNGRLICTSFLTLPSKKEFPDYYEQILLPIAVDILEGKLDRGEYTKLTGLESDVKRMVNNAKTYNSSKSDIFADAERIRKMTSNYMVKHNPAYEDKNYSAFATPLPDEREPTPAEAKEDSPEDVKTGAATKIDAEAASGEGRKTRGGGTPALQRTKSAKVVLNPDEEGYDPDFSGKTFQQAQQQLMHEMMRYKDEGGLEIFTPFINVPPKSLVEYYETIKNPTSLKSVMNKVIGFHGRAGATWVTELPSWNALENEMKKIWDNCREFNQEDSDIYALAGELETYFSERLAEAKAKVEEPPQPAQSAQPTLKINLAPKAAPIKIRLGAKPSPSPAPSRATPVPSATNDTAAKVKSPGKISLQPPAAATRQSPVKASPSPAPQARPSAPRTASGLGKSTSFNANDTKVETTATPPVNNVPLATATAASAIMPPPATSSVGMTSSMTTSAPQTIQPYVPFMAPPTGLESKWRSEGKGAADALITSLLMTSHPSLNLPRPFHHAVSASPKLCHQSVTLTVPYTHSLLQFEPTLHSALSSSSSISSSATLNGTSTPAPPAERRPYKLFVLVNGQRVQANFLPGQARLQYDIRLGVGMNRVEVECVAAKTESDGSIKTLSPSKGEELELERISVFVFVMRM